MSIASSDLMPPIGNSGKFFTSCVLLGGSYVNIFITTDTMGGGLGKLRGTAYREGPLMSTNPTRNL